MSDRLQERVLGFLSSPGKADSFEALALEVFAFQYGHSSAYRSWCAASGRSPDSVKSIGDIPAVPTAAFKELEFVCGSPAAEFRTSGTTDSGPGRHLVPSLDPYRVSALTQFRRYVLPEGGKMRIFVLAPPLEVRPVSSLSQMLSWVVGEFGDAGSGWYVSGSGLERGRLTEALVQAQSEKVPALLAGTTAAFLAFYAYCDTARVRFHLPDGSRLMDTGGRKGSGSPEVLALGEFQSMVYARTAEVLGIPQERCVNEYGMTELSSQFYDSVFLQDGGGAERPRVKHGPPWVRTFVLDPVTLDPCPAGHVGLLQHLDLANVGSVMAVLTEDLGYASERGFVLKGRPRAAAARGCGLTFEELSRR